MATTVRIGDIDFEIANLGPGLYEVRCLACGKSRRAVAGERGADAVARDHTCGGREWHG